MNSELILINYLNDALDVAAFADVPKDKPAQFITVEQTGGSSENLFYRKPQFAVQAWAGSRFKASELAANAYTALKRMPSNEVHTYKAVVNEPQNFPSEDSARYQIFVTLTIKEN